MIEKQVIEELKAKLLREKEELEKKLSKMATKSDGDYEANFQDFGRDQEANAEEVEEHITSVGITETLENKLEEVDLALEKINKGTYGMCENCEGEEIPLDRLRAYPAARTCLKCSEK